ncbi:MAG: dTMP kinase [Bacteroidales bacterium]|nr:dTMP kinase [Bacteroidales bacterium]
MLIVLEGLDGAGKSTQVSKLKQYLLEKTGELEYIHFPRYDSPVYGDLITRFLKGEFGSIEAVHPQLVALLFAEDRHGAVPEIASALAEGKVVLLDRYVYSNIAYQCAKLPSDAEAEKLRKWIFNTEFRTFGEPRPDLNIFLDVPIGFVEENLTHAREGSDRNYLAGGSDIHESSIAFQRRVMEMYLRQASEDDSLTVVSCGDAEGCMLPADVIFEKIKRLVDEKLA